MSLYVPTVRFKTGECNALSNIPSTVRRYVFPHFIVPPLKEKSSKSVLFISEEDLSNAVRRNIQRYWPEGLCYLNLSYAKSNLDKDSLLNLFRLVHDVNPRVVPVVEIDELYQPVTKLIVARSNLKIAIRLGYENLDTDRLIAGINQAGIRAEECNIFIDFSGAPLEPDIASGSVADAFDIIGQSAKWPRIIPMWSSYPPKNPAAPGCTSEIPRPEHALFNAAMAETIIRRDRFCYGDFGPDSFKIEFSTKAGGGKAIPHIRYTTSPDLTIVSRGKLGAKWPNAIQNVCNEIVKHKNFLGADYSYADKRITEVAKGSASTGGPTDWREWNMAHHMCMIVKEICIELGIPAIEEEVAEQAEQLSLV